MLFANGPQPLVIPLQSSFITVDKYFSVPLISVFQMSGRAALLAARTAVSLQRASMYNNPYITRFKERSKVSDGFYKKSTGLTGLFVNEHPHRSLSVVYSRILKALHQMPKDYAYRQYTEQIVMRRLAIVQDEKDIPQLEKKIGMGQIEEVIEQAEYELEACRAILESKAWEPLVEEAPRNQWAWPIA